PIDTLEATGRQPTKSALHIRDHAAAVQHITAWLISAEAGAPITSLAQIDAVGHRVVHGGEQSSRSTRVDDTVWREWEELVELAPLHNANNLRGITAVRAVLGPGVAQGAVLNPAFPPSLPAPAYVYAIPYQYYRRYHVRRYGFHGTSHRYIAYRYRQLT